MNNLSNLAVRRMALPVVLLAVVVLLLIVPNLVPTYYLSVATRMVIIGAFAIAFNIVFGMGGMPSLGHAAFFGAGGYVVGLGITRWGLGFGTIVLVVLAVGGLLGLIYGLLCQRVSGVYLLLMTLALGQAIWGLAFQNVGITGGDMGINQILRGAIPVDVTTREDFHAFAVVVCVFVVGCLWWFMISPVGRAIVGLRESESRMSSLGYNVALYKVCAFVVSGVACSLMGGLYAFQQGFVGVNNLEWVMSATVLLAAIVGGSRHFLGPAVGAVVIIGLEAYIMEFTERYMTYMGIFYVVIILVLPNGILGLGRNRRRPAPSDEPLDEIFARTAGKRETVV